MLLLANSADPMSAQLIAAKTGIKYAVAKVLLARMARRAELVRTGRGTYMTQRVEVATA